MSKIFQVGDKIRMLESCGDQKRGMELIVKKNEKDGLIYVSKEDKAFYSGMSLCNCDFKWEFISHGEIVDWEKELEMI